LLAAATCSFVKLKYMVVSFNDCGLKILHCTNSDSTGKTSSVNNNFVLCNMTVINTI
jgi:hypothetical protein